MAVCPSANPYLGIRKWFDQLSKDEQHNLLLYGQKCLYVHNVLSYENSLKNRTELSDPESLAYVLSLVQKNIKGVEVLTSQQHKIVVRMESSMVCLHIHNEAMVTRSAVDMFEQQLCPTANKTSAGQRHVWVFIQEVSLPRSRTSVGYQTGSGMPYFFVTGTLRHPDRLCAMLEIMWSGSRCWSGQKTAPPQPAQPLVDSLKDSIRKQEDLNSMLSVMTQRSNATIETLRQTLRRVNNGSMQRVPLVASAMDELRSDIHQVWDVLEDSSEKLTVRNTCTKLMQLYPGKYEAFTTENNFTNRLRYYQTNFRREKAFYKETNAMLSKRKRV